MSQFDQEMWQDFVVEAEENLRELEPNLLLLEQDSGNRSLLNDCFRNMHSIKGAAGYMGLESIATLTHSMESLFDKIRQGNLVLTGDAVNLIFSGVDRLRKLVLEVAERKAESSSVSDIVEDLDAILSAQEPERAGPDGHEAGSGREQELPDSHAHDVSQDEDQELFSIFAEEMQSLYNQLERLCEMSPVEVQTVNNMLKDMERVTHYVGMENLLDRLHSISSGFKERGETGDISSEEMRGLIKDVSSILKKEIGPFFHCEPVDHERQAEGHEEDRELYEIFLNFAKEMSEPLAEVPDSPDEEWLSACQETIERLRVSAHYMDYSEVVAVLDEWGERLVEALSRDEASGGFDPAPLRQLWLNLLDLLPELARDDEKTESVETHEVSPPVDEISAVDDLDAAIDQLFADTDTDVETQETEKEEPAFLEKAPEDIRIIPEKAPEKEPMIPEKAPEEVLKPAHAEMPPSAPDSVAPQTVRIDLDKIEELLGDVGELVVMRSGLTHLAEDIKDLYGDWVEKHVIGGTDLKAFKELMIRMGEHAAVLGRVTHQLQEGVMRIRMLPVSYLFNRYPRMVRDLAKRLNKKVGLNILGAETSLDKRVIEEMADPLQHIIRNAVDHGIEPPEIREKLGKPASGLLTLSATQEGNFVVIKVADDGPGFDREAIIKKAVSLGLAGRAEAQVLNDDRVWELVFLPGFTTAGSVSETSGRGVGMDVVKKNVERIGGAIKLQSSPGRGVEITIRIPLTLAIIQTLLVRVGNQTMAVPLAVVQETIRIFRDETSMVDGYEVISHRQEVLPLIRLSDIFRGTGAEKDPARLYVVIVKLGDAEAGLGVDFLIGQQEVVIKPLAEYLTDQPGFSGATILGDGSIALILDVPAILERAKTFMLRRQQMMERSALGLGEVSGLMH